jgi:hypothetical protein
LPFIKDNLRKRAKFAFAPEEPTNNLWADQNMIEQLKTHDPMLLSASCFGSHTAGEIG